MQTNLAAFIRDTAEGREADAILRKCVHCGFCTATCPTYQLLGDELDGPRGRIYLIKEVLEGKPATATTQLHLDRCLTCRSCETTCPSGVQYGRLVDIGRAVSTRQVPRSAAERASRYALSKGLRSKALFGTALLFGRACARPAARRAGRQGAARRVRGRLAGAAARAPRDRSAGLRAADARAVDRRRHGARARPHRHLRGRPAPAADAAARCPTTSTQQDEGLDVARRNIDAWWPAIERGRRGDRHHVERLRRDGQGLRPPVRARPRLREEGGAGRGARARSRWR